MSGLDLSASAMHDGRVQKALLLENLHPDAAKILASRGIEVVTRTGALDEDELIDSLQGVNIVGIRSKTQLTERVLKSAPDLTTIGAFCIGTNQIDLKAAAARGIAAFNAPFSNTRSVVEVAISNIISLVRRQPVFDKEMHAGIWNKSAIGAHEVRGKTLGIVGYGNIGTQLSVLAENLGMSVIFYDIAEKLALGNARRAKSLEDLLRKSDVVTLHVDGRPTNHDIFGAEHFAAMKPGAVFLNLARGFVVDVAALADALQSGHISGAAVDVFPTEPKRKGDPFSSPLQGLSNVILTPHTAGSTEEAQEAIGQFVSHKIVDYLSTGSTTLSVNLPNLALEQTTGAARIAHLHRNTPGVLARVNNILAEHGENIEGQLLATRGDLGYVVTDIGSSLEPETITALQAIEQTVRLQVLWGAPQQ
ncbi:phosphoglycerate dehydrogenase [Rarobacter faecitabidus]|uniref:D-3-phosphoglycerate dehydrogenase n=1 Tax=Rarobacter faecitabidus TaxID=13243 RepID=A0A542ZW94_RARFA|nr:D-3-phosphoglycerate dehydrogenase [Rarobacter faecitabidus]